MHLYTYIYLHKPISSAPELHTADQSFTETCKALTHDTLHPSAITFLYVYCKPHPWTSDFIFYLLPPIIAIHKVSQECSSNSTRLIQT